MTRDRRRAPSPAPHASSRLGRLAYRLFFHPRTWLGDRVAAALRTRRDRAMRAAAARLQPLQLPPPDRTRPPCRFLTGERFAHQTVFCARSFEWACGTHVLIEIFSDGTLRSEHDALIHRVLPHAVVHADEATAARLERQLPPDRFPRLRAMRDHCPLMRKVLDLHVGFRGPSLSLDSDMLFFRLPGALLDWMVDPRENLYMHQEGDALVGDRASLGQALGVALFPGVNSGIVALNDAAIDWDDLERAAAALTGEQRRHLWAEQTLLAYQVSRQGARPLARTDYRLCHSRADLTGALPVLRHYVHKAKDCYLADEWSRWLRVSSAGSSASPSPIQNP